MTIARRHALRHCSAYAAPSRELSHGEALFRQLPAWDRLKAALLGAFSGVGADLQLARRLYYVVQQAGLSDVQFRPFIVGVRSTDPMVDYLPATVESLRGTILALALMSEAELMADLAACREHLRQPHTAFTMYTVAQVWGRKGH